MPKSSCIFVVVIVSVLVGYIWNGFLCKAEEYDTEVSFFLENEKYGVISVSTEEILIEPRFDEVSHWFEDLALDWNSIPKEGKDEFRDIYYALVSEGGEKGVVDSHGNLLAEPVWDDIEQIYCGYITVIKDGKKGIIDRWGQEIIAPEWQSILYDYEGRYFSIADNNGVGTLMQDGTIGIEPVWEEIGPVREGFAFYTTDGTHWGIMTEKGSIITEPVYFHVFGSPWFSEGLAAVWIEDMQHVGYVDYTGEFVIDPIFADGKAFHDGKAEVKEFGTRIYRYIDIEGHFL